MFQTPTSTNANGISPHRLVLYLLKKRYITAVETSYFSFVSKRHNYEKLKKKTNLEKYLLGTKFRENGPGN